MTDPNAGLLRADSVALPLADDTVDLVVTSPPYFALRSYTDGGEHYDGQIGSEPTPREFLEALWAVTRECARVLKPSGSMFVNLGDKYSRSAGAGTDRTLPGVGKGSEGKRLPNNKASTGGIPEKSLMGLPWRYAIGCIDDLDLILRAELVWSKPNGLPESVTDRVRRSHEQFFHFVKEPRYYSAVDEVREPHTGGSNPGRSDGKPPPGGKTERLVATGDHGGNYGGTNPDLFNPLGKLPGSVWSIPSEPLKVPEWLGVDHFAAYPQEWPRRLILGWSPPGICVECGQGRRPVCSETRDESLIAQRSSTRGRSARDAVQVGKPAATMALSGADYASGAVTHEITGYACDCPTPDAPTRPAVVLDPFGGTGTTSMVARALGRFGVNVDLSNDYLRLARWRIFQSGHATKTVERTNRDRQQTMFGAA
jgi:DNA modification methylase